ncbi:6-phosphogluconate dehydrogenase C-terminal domain-like protein [Thelephora ganbajun]|uniref:6-phosphogluconate dehydrogenase C-terminal domain-like protein n=1 Tax=Thelephora ganbajun TaxID=370292 RepID=A0ACB6ZQI0_THEGA|nr:6-phosphogluconate dehydrogenase C-terminal domain-like protein [Thelephora ganbajun]
MLEVCVVGFGALGSFYSFALERSGQARVTAVCRSSYETVKDHGLDVDSNVLGKYDAWRPYRVVASTQEAADRQYRFVVCTFKALPDVISTPDLLGPLLDHGDSFVLIQNGVGVEGALRRRLPMTTIISGCAWIDATIVEKGRLLTQYGPERLTLGVHPLTDGKPEEESLEILTDLLLKGGTTPEPESDIVAQRWRKVLWNVAYSSLCTVSRATMRELLAEPHIELVNATIKEIMGEIILVARMSGIHTGTLLEDEAVDIIRRVKPTDFKPSMLVDLEANRPIEVEVILGEVVREAAEVGVPVPRLQVLYTSLKAIQHKLLANRRQSQL